jgi:hypothetical protein
MIQGLLAKSKPNMHIRKATKYVGIKRLVLQIEPSTTYRKYKKSAHMSLRSHPISQPSLDITPM